MIIDNLFSLLTVEPKLRDLNGYSVDGITAELKDGFDMRGNIVTGASTFYRVSIYPT